MIERASIRRLWFPLRSSATVFGGSRPQLDLETRVKEAVLLADELTFEGGGFQLGLASQRVNGRKQVWSHGKYDPGVLLAEQEGRAAWVAAAADEEERVARVEQLGFASLEQMFEITFEGLLSESGLDRMPWVSVRLDDETLADEPDAPQHEPWNFHVASFVDSLLTFGHAEVPPEPRTGYDFEEWVRFFLRWDLWVASRFDQAAVVDPALRQVFEAPAGSESSAEGPTGVEALRLWVPNLSAVPWSDVVALHDHDAIGSFREALLEAELTVAPLPREEQKAALEALEVDALAARIRELIPSPAQRAASVAVSVIFDSLPLPFVGSIATAVQEVAEWQRQRSHWTAVLVELWSKSRAGSGPLFPTGG